MISVNYIDIRWYNYISQYKLNIDELILAVSIFMNGFFKTYDKKCYRLEETFYEVK